ncbi:DgyrCDS6505 [Dimorphilus gyrociliatus]|uniref:DgyrCDS6505 n=1 Tax=Dimorphilus gyrociliatus TaxID=2664684 RepID=A0A7I8VN94_9ANNE|nr:DgyrCDS6505 [Dimorphilus gyrociliatus]
MKSKRKSFSVNKPIENEDDRKEKTKKSVSFFKLFRYLTGRELLLVLLAVFGSLSVGVAIPANVLIYSQTINKFVNYTSDSGFDIHDEIVTTLVPYSMIIACTCLFLGFMQMFFWQLTSAKQKRKLRMATFDKLMRMHQGWYDHNKTGEITSKLFGEIDEISDAVGHKLGSLLQAFSQITTGLVIGFTQSWRLSLIVLAMSPIIAASIVVLMSTMKKMSQKELKAYGHAGSIASETFGAIRIVFAFGAEKKHSDEYEEKLSVAKTTAIRKAFVNGLGMGIQFTITLGSMAFPFWYGNKLVDDGTIDGGQMISTIFGILVGVIALGNGLPSLQQISIAQAAAANVFEIIDQETEIDYADPSGSKLTNINGNIEIEGVHFSYPSRPDIPILKDFNIHVKPQQTVALVGRSGSGKSTTVQLLMKLYNFKSGDIRIDSKSIKSLNIESLRKQISIVSQEPMLFSTTIMENIALGKPDASESEIIEAARLANAHQFVSNLPDGYETLVGESGTQLSGGQKQRIALARALIRKPEILLLDEATSALDAKSEAIVQEALDRASKNRTTIVIAHRLSTIRNADRIYVVDEGSVCEYGTHEELLEKDGAYAQLIKNQLDTHSVVDTNLTNDDMIHENDVKLQELDDSDDEDDIEEISENSSQTDTGVVIKKRKSLFLRLLKLNSPEIIYLCFGGFFSLVDGCIMPVFSLALSQQISNFDTLDKDERKEQSLRLSLAFALIALLHGVFTWLAVYLLGIAGERLTERLRKLTFRSILRQEVGWFDRPTNSIGALTALLAAEAGNVHKALGDYIRTLLYTVSTVVCALSIAFYYSWRLALFALLFAPLSLSSGVLQTYMSRSNFAKHKRHKKDFVKSLQSIATEVLNQIKTVVMLSQERYFLKKFKDGVTSDYTKEKRTALMFGIVYGVSTSAQYFCFGGLIAIGSYLVKIGDQEFGDIFRVAITITVCATSLGRSAGMSIEYKKAKTSAKKIFRMLDRVPLIDGVSENAGKQLENFRGAISFKGIDFAYPMRSKSKILRDFNLEISPGTTIALVGSSGAGKSTITVLLERFYEIEKGLIAIDGENMKNLSVSDVRSKMAIVTQEPILFGRSIAENIKYGLSEKDVSEELIIEAAKQANIHDFIESLPEKYETNVGQKGTQLSGGQKQRIAIARALIRKPTGLFTINLPIAFCTLIGFCSLSH